MRMFLMCFRTLKTLIKCFWMIKMSRFFAVIATSLMCV